ncbi:TRAP transporter small permease [Arenibaculum sp.]|jgi:TRAP-type C4-dicarboxylate transport system permease small subunit|uniref:TRAP transporter small permease n=1 Tax=Arenibaculum sp. TaxID=2865862 RepID=UPI002E15F3C3|nr:TRAP transporter small permease [Arenibaculum sp.]
MRRLAQALRALVLASAVVGVLAYAAAALLTVADIVGRQTGMPIPGVVDLVQLCVLGGAWLVIPHAFLAGAHVGVDLLVESFPRAVERPLRALASLAAVGLLGLMLVYCYEAFQQQLLYGDRSQQLGIPIVWYWVPLLFGLALSAVAAALTVFSTPHPQAAR